MPKKVSEKSLLFPIACFVIGIVILAKAQLITTPVRVSETGVLADIAAVGLLIFGVFLFRKSVVKI